MYPISVLMGAEMHAFTDESWKMICCLSTLDSIHSYQCSSVFQCIIIAHMLYITIPWETLHIQLTGNHTRSMTSCRDPLTCFCSVSLKVLGCSKRGFSKMNSWENHPFLAMEHLYDTDHRGGLVPWRNNQVGQVVQAAVLGHSSPKSTKSYRW